MTALNDALIGLQNATTAVLEQTQTAQALVQEVNDKVSDIDAALVTTEEKVDVKVVEVDSALAAINSRFKGMFNKAITSEPAFQLDDDGITPKVAGDLLVEVNGELYQYAEGTELALPDGLQVGTDYAIFATADGLVVSQNFTYPDDYSASTARRVGGFHYQDGVINPYSFYDLKYKPDVRDPRGMARSPLGIWADIYLLNTNPDLNGTSAYNVTIADGSSLPNIPAVYGGDGTTSYDDLSQYTATRVLAAYGKRLPNSHEFESLAYGSVTGYLIDAEAVTTQFDASAKSMIGCEQVSGHMWQWGSERWGRGDGSSGYGWYAADTNGEGQVHASGSLSVGANVFGGYWLDSANTTGPRASAWSLCPWSSYYHVAARGICNHFESL